MNIQIYNIKKLEYLPSYNSSTKCKTNTESLLSINKDANLKDANSSAKKAVLSIKLKRSVFKSYPPHQSAKSLKSSALVVVSASKNAPSKPSKSSTSPKTWKGLQLIVMVKMPSSSTDCPLPDRDKF